MAKKRLNFAVLLESEADVVKWLKPMRNFLKIAYSDSHNYEPDFIVETATHKLLCEPKNKDMLGSDEVQAKTKAAVEWCKVATKHELANNGKPWSYILIPHDKIKPSATLAGLVAQFKQGQ